MAETDLKITVTTDSTELQDLVSKLNKGDLTVKEYNKTLRALRDASVVGSKSQMDLKSVVTQVGEQTATANGKMMKSYFQTGEELRRFYREQRLGDRTMREATATIGGLGSMLGGEGIGRVVSSATSRFQEMEFAVNGVGIAAQGGSAKVASLGQKLIGMAGPLAVAAGGFALLKLAFDEALAVTERFNKSLERNTQLLIKIGQISKQQQIEILDRQIKASGKGDTSPNWLLGLFPGSIGTKALGEDVMTKMLDKSSKITEQLSLRNKLAVEEAAAWEAIWETSKAELETEKQIKDNAKEIANYRKQWQSQGEQAIAGGFSRRGIGGKVGTGIGLRSFESSYYSNEGGLAVEKKYRVPGSLQGVGGVGDAKFMTDQISSAQIAANSLGDSMNRSFQEATSYLAEGFATAFGLGNSLLDRMISTFASSALMALPGMIAGMLTAGATGNIFTALGALIFDEGGVIREPVIGMGVRSKRPYGFAMNGQPEYVSTMNQVGQARRYAESQPSVTIHNHFDKSGIATVVEQGNMANKRKRIGGGR